MLDTRRKSPTASYEQGYERRDDSVVDFGINHGGPSSSSKYSWVPNLLMHLQG